MGASGMEVLSAQFPCRRECRAAAITLAEWPPAIPKTKMPPMDHMLPALLATLAAYLVGSLSFAVLVSRVLGLADPRSYGSGNPGATNVLRSGSKLAAVLTLVLDAAKGWLPVALVGWFGEPYGLEGATVALVGLAAFLGHLYPVFFRFQGGKGVATAFGVLLGISGWLALATVATWLIVVVFLRYSSLASLVAAVFAPAFYFFGGAVAWPLDLRILAAVTAMSLLLAWRHRANIRRLLSGSEPRLGVRR